MLGKQVLDQHKGHTRCRWQAVEQTAEGLETAGGSADANNRKWLGRRLGLLARRRAQRLAPLTLPLCSRLPALELALHRILTLTVNCLPKRCPIRHGPPDLQARMN